MNKHTALLIPLVVLFIAPSCRTIPQEQILAYAAGSAARVGSTLYLKEHPEARDNFMIVRDMLTVMIDEGNTDVTEFTSIMQLLPINELEDPTAKLMIKEAVELFHLGKQAILDDSSKLAPYLTSIRDGIADGLAFTDPS